MDWGVCGKDFIMVTDMSFFSERSFDATPNSTVESKSPEGPPLPLSNSCYLSSMRKTGKVSGCHAVHSLGVGQGFTNMVNDVILECEYFCGSQYHSKLYWSFFTWKKVDAMLFITIGWWIGNSFIVVTVVDVIFQWGVVAMILLEEFSNQYHTQNHSSS